MRPNCRGADTLEFMLAKAEHCIKDNCLDDAAEIYKKLLASKPQSADLHHTLGLVYFELGRMDRAIAYIERSIRINPHLSTAYRSLGDAYQRAGRLDDAISAYQKARSFAPKDPDTILNLGNALHRMERLEEALATYHEVFGILPNHLKALNNAAKTLQDMGNLDQALRYYDRCVQIDPDYAEARFNRATALLTLGRYQPGWIEFEWRFKRRGAHKVYPHRLQTPRWRGGTYSGKRLLVHCEQGMGDVLQFVRYLPKVKELGGTLILEVHPPLLPLLASMDCVDELIAFHPGRPPAVIHDFHIPLLSLPMVFKTTAITIPHTFPYLQCDSPGCAQWRKQVSIHDISVGLVWQSSALNPRRNCPLDQCASWFQIPGIQFYGLQTGQASEQLRPFSSDGSIISLGEQFKNFNDTAAAISNLDLVISVDTATAHLAGAMGRHLWVLLPKSPDWRWPHGFPDSLWYTSARLFRQTKTGSWDSVIAEVAEALEVLRSSHGRLHLSPGAVIEASKLRGQKAQSNRPVAHHGMRIKIAVDKPRVPNYDIRPRAVQNAMQSQRGGMPKIRKVLLISPILGGSLEVIRYLYSGFLQANIHARLIDNSSYYPVFEKIDRGPYDQEIKEQMFARMIDTIDEELMTAVDSYKPDLVLAIAQSPIHDHTVLKLKAKGIVVAYWFVEDYRFRQYWAKKAPLYDFFFTIQRNDYLKARFTTMNHLHWHYLPLGCDPKIHKSWKPSLSAQSPFNCQIGFMGAPYRNRIKVFETLSHLDLGIWGEGWNSVKLSQGLKTRIREGSRRITPQESVKIYCSADIVLNLHSSALTDGISEAGDFVNPRTFEVAACGGFQLTDNRKELADLFSPGEEIVVFQDLEELPELIDYWLSHPHKRKMIAQKAQRRALRDHCYKLRAKQIIATIETTI
jgi:spore maturation protein CgeB/Flp pilus assembly protein TadD